MPTKIEWATDTINPLVGCSPVSESCANCYAAKMAWRLKCIGVPKYQNVVTQNGWNGKLATEWSDLDKPLKWRKPRRIFIGSMTDMFHERIDIDSNFYDRVMHRIRSCGQHTFMLLTKRVDRMAWVFKRLFNNDLPPNLLVGATVETQPRANERIPILLTIPAAVRFVSFEPMISPISTQWAFKQTLNGCELNCPTTKGTCRYHSGECSSAYDSARGIDWVICGAETGPKKRSMDLDWARSLRDQCVSAGVPFFFKKDSAGNHELDGRVWEQFQREV